MKLNVCCGQDYREGYINIDFSDVGVNGSKVKIDVVHDILNGLPYPENSADEIVFREALEHFHRLQGLDILKELYRVLKPGGKLDLTVPPALKQLKMLLIQLQNAKSVPIEDFLYAHERFSVWKWHDDLMGAPNPKKAYGDSHLTLFSPETLRTLVEHVGFKVLTINEEIQLYATK